MPGGLEDRPPESLLPTETFYVKYEKKKAKVSINGSGIKIENDRRTKGNTVYVLGSYSIFDVKDFSVNKKNIEVRVRKRGDKPAGTMVFETKEGGRIAATLEQGQQAAATWKQLQKTKHPEAKAKAKAEDEAIAGASTGAQPQQPHPAAAPVRYRAVAKGVIREYANKQSPKCGELAPGDEIVMLAKENIDGTVRVQFDRGWVSVAAASGKELLEVVEDGDAGDSGAKLESESDPEEEDADGLVAMAAELEGSADESEPELEAEAEAGSAESEGSDEDVDLEAMAAELEGSADESEPELEPEPEEQPQSQVQPDLAPAPESGIESEPEPDSDGTLVKSDKEAHISAPAAAPVRYRAVAKGVIREYANKQSPKCGELAPGDEIVMLAKENIDGTVRVQFD
eukprot:COSAG02_NODE_4540_length_5235_cov_4.163357_7_plen_398_part_01